MSFKNKFGTKTPRVVVFKCESHKLHQAFPIAKADNVMALIPSGSPVALLEDGTIKATYDLGSAKGVHIGYSLKSSDNAIYPGYPNDNDRELTVVTTAHAVVYGLAKTELKAGYVTPSSTSNGYVEYTASVDPTDFVAMAPAAAGDLVQILMK